MKVTLAHLLDHLIITNSSLDIVSPIEREIRSLSHGLSSVKDEQEYIVIRERTHRNTAESTNDRVKWWSILQVAVLFAVVAWQVFYLKVSRQTCVYLYLILMPRNSRSSRSSGRSSLWVSVVGQPNLFPYLFLSRVTGGRRLEGVSSLGMNPRATSSKSTWVSLNVR